MNGRVQSSLKSAVTRASVHTAMLTIVIVVIGTFAYYSAAKVSAIDTIQKELADHVADHIEQVLPSFLLPEQKGALPHQIERIKNQGDLSRLSFIESLSDLPGNFKNCVLDTKPRYCSAEGGSEVGILAPVMGGEQLFGYLFETKVVSGSYTFQTFSAVVIAFIFVMSVFVFILFSLFHKITGKRLPRDIDSLLKYVQGLLQENPTMEKPTLEFSDFSVLREGIATIFNNYKRTQNQAIVGHFATGVLHDIKTQLQSIVAASELAEEAKNNHTKYESRLENLQQVIQKNLPDLQGIIKSTLDANREINLSLQLMDIEDTIKSSIEYTKAQEEFREIEIGIEKSQEKVFLNHDRAQVIRLFFNLIKNALEAQCKKKSVRDKKVLVSIEDVANKILVRVEDSGPGFKVDVSDIFDPFVTTKKYGVGFGLYNAQKIVAAHGWTIAASISEQLGGACFEVTIPKEVNL